MSYHIEYNPELKEKYPKVRKRRELPTRKMLVLLSVLIASYIFVQYRLYYYFIPGNPDITSSAFSTMIESVGEGEPVKDAFSVFCKEIIQNGNP